MLPTLSRTWVILALMSLCLKAADTNAPTAGPANVPAAPAPADNPNGNGLNLAGLFSFVQGLELNPKVVTGTDGKGTTVGLDYKFDRGTTLTSIGKDKQTDVEFAFKSSGMILAEPAKVPNNVFTHTLRLSLINLWSTPAGDGSLAQDLNKKLNAALDHKFDTWSKLTILKDPTDAQKAEMDQLEQSASQMLKEVGSFRATRTSQPPDWKVTLHGEEKTYDRAVTALKQHPPFHPLFLSADLDGNLEHDQTLTNLQFVGSAQFRGKVLSPIFDFPFRMLRRVTSNSDGTPANWLNRAGGPYFWGGIGYVDASSNDARKAVTTAHERFPRAHAGVDFRTELFGTTESNAIALELSWRYYHEFDAPAQIKVQGVDDTHYFKGTILLPRNYFVEYTNGKLPIDLKGGSTVAVGWRYNF